MASVEKPSGTSDQFVPAQEQVKKKSRFQAGDEFHEVKKSTTSTSSSQKTSFVAKKNIPETPPGSQTWKSGKKAMPVRHDENLDQAATPPLSRKNKESFDFAATPPLSRRKTTPTDESLDQAATPPLSRKPTGPAPMPPHAASGMKPPKEPAPEPPGRSPEPAKAHTREPTNTEKPPPPSRPAPPPPRSQSSEKTAAPPIAPRRNDPAAALETKWKQEGIWFENRDAASEALQSDKQYVVLQNHQDKNIYFVGVMKEGEPIFASVPKQRFHAIVSELGMDDTKIGDRMRASIKPKPSRITADKFTAIAEGAKDIDRLRIAYNDPVIEGGIRKKDEPLSKKESLTIAAAILNVSDSSDENAMRAGRKQLIKQIHSDKAEGKDDLTQFWNALWEKSGMK